jgi:hypothetical protein
MDCGNPDLACDRHGLCYETKPPAGVHRTVEEQSIFLLNDTDDDYFDAAAEGFRSVVKRDPTNARAKCYLDMAIQRRRPGIDGGCGP